MNDVQQLLVKRRTCYNLTNKASLPDEKIKELIDSAVLHVPSAFNSQSARIVLLLNEHHRKLWEITIEVLSEIVSHKAFEDTKAKITNSFAAGHGTILFFEDQAVVRSMQENFPLYADNFPVWSEHTSAMHQYIIWLLLANEGMGASLQHYNPLINQRVEEEWGIDPDWRLIAQMPFGIPAGKPAEKAYKPLEERSVMFR